VLTLKQAELRKFPLLAETLQYNKDGSTSVGAVGQWISPKNQGQKIIKFRKGKSYFR